MAFNLIKFANKSTLFTYAAQSFIKLAQKTLENKPYFDVALSGGSTAQAFFKILAQEMSKEPFLARIRFFVSDERVVALSSPDSNAANAQRLLLEPLAINSSNFFPLFDASCAPEKAAQRYEELLEHKLRLNSQKIPVFDLIYLGLGSDGHTASLFPKSSLLDNLTNLVAASDEEYAGYRRLTFMPKLINAAKNICFLVTGQEKAQVLESVCEGSLDPRILPAQLVARASKPAIVELLYAP